MKVLKTRAAERGVNLHVVGTHPQILSGEAQLGLDASYQKSNASLAVAATAVHLRRLGHQDVPDLLANPTADLPSRFRDGLKSVKWPGRSDIRKDGKTNITWFLDGAHTLESISLATLWFVDHVRKRNGKNLTLIFNQQTRDASALLKTLHSIVDADIQGLRFSRAIFTSNEAYKDSGHALDFVSMKDNPTQHKTLEVQNRLAKAWRNFDPSSTEPIVCQTIEEAINLAREGNASASGGDENLVFVVGSLHLVGGFLEVLEAEKSITEPLKLRRL